MKQLHSQRVTAWSGISAFGINGPCFSEDETSSAVIVTSDRYMHMANEFLFREGRRRDIDLATFWFQQAGATARTSRQSMNTLKTVFELRIISLYGKISWPARSAELSACDWVLCVSNTSGRLT
jgi:hypothetical protein